MMSDLRQSPQYAAYMSHTGWQVLTLKEKILVYKRPLGPLGSLIKIQRFSWPIDLNQLDKLAHEHRALFVKLEPAVLLSQLETDPKGPLWGNCPQGIPLGKLETDLRSHGFRLDSWPLLPTQTRVIDLSQTTTQLLSDCSENCRRNLRKSKKSGVKIKVGDWQWFYPHWQAAAKVKNLVIPNHRQFQSLVEYFGPNLKIINCYHHDHDWLAAIIMPISGRRAYYYYATSAKLGQQLRAPDLATWTAIILAKKHGCTLFDFDGIADPRYPAMNNRAWKGFSRFKAKFGGRQVTYVGSFIKYYGPGKLLSLLEKIFPL